MDFLNIGKIRGVIYSTMIVAFYYLYWLPYWHYYRFGFEHESGWGTTFVLIGLIMTQAIVIQHGDQAELNFLGMNIKLEKRWGQGLAFMPNILHTTIVLFNFAIFWGLAVLKSDKYKRYEEPPVIIDSVDGRFNYRANVTMTPGQARRNQAIDFIWKLLWDYKRVPEEYYVSSAGYRILVIGIILVYVNSTWIATTKKVEQVGQSVNQALGIKQAPPKAAYVTQSPQAPKNPDAVTPKNEEVKPPVDLGPFWFRSSLEAVSKFEYSVLQRAKYEEFGVFLGTDQNRRDFFGLGPRKEELSRVTLLRTDAFCVVIPRNVIAELVVAQPPTFGWNVRSTAVISLRQGTSVRGQNVFDPPGYYWENYTVPWDDIYNRWSSYKNWYGVKQQVGENSYTLVSIGLGAGSDPKYDIGVLCFGTHN